MPGTRKVKKTNIIEPIHSLCELRTNITAEYNPKSYEKYRQLAIISAKNLGAPQPEPTLEQALRWLEINASETNEEGVIGEINFCLDLVK